MILKIKRTNRNIVLILFVIFFASNLPIMNDFLYPSVKTTRFGMVSGFVWELLKKSNYDSALSYKTIIVFLNLISLLVSYYGFKLVTKNRLAGLAGALLLVLSPCRIIMIYNRSDLLHAELICLFPILLIAIMSIKNSHQIFASIMSGIIYILCVADATLISGVGGSFISHSELSESAKVLIGDMFRHAMEINPNTGQIRIVVGIMIVYSNIVFILTRLLIKQSRKRNIIYSFLIFGLLISVMVVKSEVLILMIYPLLTLPGAKAVSEVFKQCKSNSNALNKLIVIGFFIALSGYAITWDSMTFKY